MGRDSIGIDLESYRIATSSHCFLGVLNVTTVLRLTVLDPSLYAKH